jgi:glutamine---fructose-6-phosphate transaminase (isomerizing)
LDKKKKYQTSKEKIDQSPYPFPHFTIKEIFEQPTSLSRALNFGGRFASDSSVRLGGLELNKEWLLKIENLVIVACK